MRSTSRCVIAAGELVTPKDSPAGATRLDYWHMVALQLVSE